MIRLSFAISVALAFSTVAISPALRAQQLDFSRGGPVAITATDGLEWNQNEQQVIARGDAKAVRGNVTVSADRLVAYYRKKAGAPAEAPAGAGSASPTSGNEIYRVEALGKVHITSGTEQVWGERAVYDMDQGVMLMTGGALKLTTPNQVLTARDSLEYYAAKRMSVARGKAVVVTTDGRRVQADTLVAFSREAGGKAPAATDDGGGKPIAGSGKLQRVEAFGNVVIRTATDTVTGDRAVYVADSGLARIGGNVRISRGQNQFAGSDAVVNTNTGVANLLAGSGGRVAGLVIPNDGKAAPEEPAKAPDATPPARRRGTRP